jgi:hypothetical protein
VANIQQNESRELSAQELSEVAGGVFDPNNNPKPADGSYNIKQTVNIPNVGELVDQELKEYSDQNSYPKPYNNAPEGC